MLPVLAVLAAGAIADPLAPAWAGQVQCYAPDPELKQCASIGGYRREMDGKIMNTAIVAISKSPAITMSTLAEVKIEQGRICSLITPADIEGAAFRVEGASATVDQAAQLKRAMASAMQPLFGRKVCVSPAGEAWVDGTRTPKLDQTVGWVPARAGYAVRMP